MRRCATPCKHPGRWYHSRMAAAAVTVHENLTLLTADDEAAAAEMLSVPAVRAALVRRLSPTVIALDPDRLPAVLDTLERRGYFPRVVGTGSHRGR